MLFFIATQNFLSYLSAMENKIVRKSNALVEASYKLTAQEQWVILFLTSMIKSHDEDFKEYSISIKEFSEIAGVRHKGEYQEVKEITKKLIGRVFTINEPSGPLQISWLSSAKYLNGEGNVILKFDPNLKPYLLQLKNRFTKYNLHQVMQLKSSFSIRIYELLKQYENVKERSVLVDDFREMLGIDPEEYPKYGNFKQKVLNVAQKEIEEKTDITFDYEEIKVGRGVGKIRFYIKSKPLQIPQSSEVKVLENSPTSQNDPDLEKLTVLLPADYRQKVSIQKLLKTWLVKRGFEYVSRNIEYANDCSNAVHPGANLTKGSNYRNYLAKTLAGDFGLPYKEDLEVKRKAEEEAKQKAQEEANAKKQQLEQAKKEKKDHERVRIFHKELTAEALEQLKAEAFSRLIPQQQEAVNRKGFGYEMMLKLMMDEIARERMKIS